MRTRILPAHILKSAFDESFVVIQPPPRQAGLDCGVFEECKWVEPLKWTARSPIGHAFPPPQALNIPPNFRRHKQGRRFVPRPIAEYKVAHDG